MGADGPSLDKRGARRVGTVLRGKYRILAVLGAGGMATVYAAAHRNGSRVAIKILHEELSFLPSMRARFLREGYLANRVGHAGAVRVIDDDVAEDGAAFLVMELLRGETLRARSRRAGGRLPCREVLALGRDLLEVLRAAHGAGIVHRDIKPDNLFLTTSRVLKVLDFGIARLEDELGPHATATGARIGTPAYMPPELALGRSADVDARTDVWSVGAALFNLISGSIVHEGETSAEIAVRAATTPARSLAAVAPGTPGPIVALVDRALAFRREDRWPSAAAMSEALSAAYAAAYGGQVSADDVGPVVEETAAGGALETTVEPGIAADPKTTLPNATGADPHGKTESVPTPGSARPSLSHASTEEAVPRSASSTGLRSTVATPDTAPPVAARPPSWRPRILALAGLAVLAAAMAARALPATRPPAATTTAASATVASATAASCASSADCGGGDVCARSGRCVARRDCADDRTCVARSGGAAAICRKEDGVCVALATDACTVLADPAAVGDDATVWLGALFPHRMSDKEHYGPRAANAVELARRDFAETSGGLPPARPGGPRRPIGVVLCDDARDAERSARHLVEDVGVPAVIGFATSKEVLDLASTLLLPRGVLTIVAVGAATTLRDIPQPPGEPRLLWRVTVSTDAVTWPFAATLERELEPEIRAAPGLLRPGEPVRVALLRHDSLVGQTTADSRVRELRFNGKGVAENGAAFLQVGRANFVAGGDFTAENERTARAVAAFLPHVVVDMPPYPALLAAIERAWPREAPFRPRYLGEGTWNDLGQGIVDWQRDGLYRRVFSVDLASSGEPALRFALRYNEFFTPKTTPETAMSSPYDAFYLVAYAAAALGAEPVSGRTLAAAIPRLLPRAHDGGDPQPPGVPVDVGPAGIYPAFLALGAGRSLDLRGAATSLDLDPATGETRADFSLYCVAPPGAHEPPRQVDAGLVFDGRRHEVRGTRRCPP